MNQLAKKEMVDGMNHDMQTQTQKECEACVLGKMQKKPFPKQNQHRATSPYEIVHSDVCGPMQVESKGGSRYMLTFTDDFSRYTTAYFIKSKSEVLSKFMEYVNSVEKHTGVHIMKLNILTEEDVKVLRRPQKTLPITLLNSVLRKEFQTNSLYRTVHSKMELLRGGCKINALPSQVTSRVLGRSLYHSTGTQRKGGTHQCTSSTEAPQQH